MTLTKIVVTPDGPEEIELTQDEISQQTIDANYSAQFLSIQNWQTYQSEAQQFLDKSDVTIARCTENSVSVPSEWRAYRISLRAIISAPTGDSTQSLPTRPEYPSGT